MAHLVETAAYVDEPAWHGVGTVVKGATSVQEIVKLAGLDWEVEKAPLSDYFDGQRREVPGAFVIRRKTDGKQYGLVKSRYRPIQNAEAAGFLDELFATGDLQAESAMSLEFGRRAVIVARIPEDIRVAGDKVYPYLVYSNAHDGLKACNVWPTSVRVVCNNTERAAWWSRDKSLTVHIPHVGDVHGKIATARSVLGLSLDIFRLWGETMEMLAAEDGLPLVRPFLQRMFPAKEGEEKPGQRTEAKAAEVEALFSREPGQTAHGLLNAFTAWVDHVNLPATSRDNAAGPKGERIVASALMGRGSDDKARAAEILASMTGIYERQQAAMDALKVRVRVLQRAA